MSFEDDMIEYGFTDGNDYMDYLYDEAERNYNRMEDRARRSQEYEEWLDTLSDDDLEEMRRDKLLQKQRRREEEMHRKKLTLNNELCLKQWIFENPKLARVWFAYYDHSTDIDSSRFDSFIDFLGSDDSKHHHCHENSNKLFKEWKEWNETYEEYAEFKEKAPIEWMQFKWATDASYVWDAINQYICRKFSKCTETAGIHHLLQMWINDHQQLWGKILAQREADNRREEDYLFQSWSENFSSPTKLEIWKCHNPKLWKDFLHLSSDELYKIQEEVRLFYSDDEFFEVYLNCHKSSWNAWVKKNIVYWENQVAHYNLYLWVKYTNEKWKEHLKAIESKSYIESLTSNEDNNISGILTDEISDEEFENLLEDEYEDEDEDDVYVIYEKFKLSFNDFSWYTETERNSIIENYKKELEENSEKKKFIDSDCTLEDMAKFFEDYDMKFKTSKMYADNMLKAHWRLTHGKEWDLWKREFIWDKYYGSQLWYNREDQYYAWKIIHKRLWKKWINSRYRQFKEMAYKVSLWHDWIMEDNNAILFDTWAKDTIKDWEDIKFSAMQYDLEQAFSETFNLYFKEFINWKINNGNEWEYWKDIIDERLLILSFKHDDPYRPYTPKFKEKIELDEIRYRAKSGEYAFHDNLAPVEVNGKYGYINPAGKIIITPIFDKAFDFSNNTAIVMVYKHTTQNNAYNHFIAKWGIINTCGEYLVEPIYDNLSYIGNDLLFRINNVSINGIVESRYGLMNDRFEEFIPAKYSSIQYLHHGLFLASIGYEEDQRFGLLSHNGDEITEFKYSYIDDSYSELIIANINGTREEDGDGGYYCRDGQWGFIDLNGCETQAFIPCENIYDFLRKKP